MRVFSCPAQISESSPTPRMERIRAKQEKHRQGRLGLGHSQEPLEPGQEPGEWLEPQGPLSTGVSVPLEPVCMRATCRHTGLLARLSCAMWSLSVPAGHTACQ